MCLLCVDGTVGCQKFGHINIMYALYALAQLVNGLIHLMNQSASKLSMSLSYI